MEMEELPSIVKGTPLAEEPGQGVLTIPGYLREVTTRYADREALVYRTAAGILRWSYADLWERSIEVARALLACGVGKDTRVGILMTNRPEFLAAMFGTALAGGVVVALNTFSTPPELEYLVQASSVSLLLFERTVAGKDFGAILGDLEPAIKAAKPGALESAKFPFLRRLAVVGAEMGGAVESWAGFVGHAEAVPGALVDATAATVKASDTGVLFFSSGTTSQPKGILHAHRAVAIQWWRWPRIFGVGDDVRCWTANGFFWSGNFSLLIGNGLTTGGTLVLQSTFQAEEALELIQAERVTLPVASPHQAARMEAAANFARVDLGSLRYIDERSPLAKHPTVKVKWRLPPSFGTTETLTINCSFPNNVPADVDGGHGMPLPGNTLKIIDPATGAVVPRGQRGEIAIKGPTLMLGYLGKPADETLDPEGFYRTGDGGYVTEGGWLFFEGRLSDIVKTGGANVSPIEIDTVIRTYPGVKLTQTVGVPHETLGEMVVACIVPHEGVVLDETALRDFLKERLASYKVPRGILFLRDDELAMTGSAKVKAGDLRKLVRERLSAVQ
jgi:acyl-CoA synthetase (AMP-forming)/AMP-acid ligase II